MTLTGVHLFDNLRWFVGRSPDAVSARVLAVDGFPTSNLFDACFEYELEPILCATEVSKFSDTRSCVMELVGTKGQLIVDYQHGWIDRLVGSRLERVESPGNPPTLPETLRHSVERFRRAAQCPSLFTMAGRPCEWRKRRAFRIARAVVFGWKTSPRKTGRPIQLKEEFHYAS